MCDFISWINYEGKVYCLTNDDLETKDGKKLLLPAVIADLCGHGGIRSYYPELAGKGTDCECTDFSTPKNFPQEIAFAIKKGKLSRFGFDLELFNQQGRDKYEAIDKPARDKYEAIEKLARDKYEAIGNPAFWKIFSIKKYRNKKWL